METNKRVTLMASIVKQLRKEVMKMNRRMALIALLLSISLISQVSAVTGTYVDVTPSNTVAVDDTDPWYSIDDRVEGFWRQRDMGDKPPIYEIYNITAPDLKTTISDLIPGQVYDIYVIYWSQVQPWGVLTGLDPNGARATWYNFETGTETGPTCLSGKVHKMEALVGTTTANVEGKIDMYVFNPHFNANQRTWLDGFSYQQAFLSYNPQPAHQAESVALDAQLSWSTMLDPCNPAQACPAVEEHWVYFGETPDLTSEHLLTKVPVSVEQASPPPLQADKRYYWCVDETFADGSYALGVIWTFETIKTLPSFDPPLGTQPENVRAAEGQTIVLTAMAGTTAGPVGNCQWYKGLPGGTSSPLSDEPDHISGAQSNQLTMIVGSADEGSYFCQSTNAAGTADSKVATLLLKRLLAWYKFDDDLNDSAGTNHGTMANPVYVDGMDGKALSFDGTNYVNLGTDGFPKSGFSNGLETGSVSFWTNAPAGGHSFTGCYNDGDTTAFDVWITTNYLSFMIRGDNNAELSWGFHPAGSLFDAWHLITCTWDTESGEAAVYLDGVRRGGITGEPSDFAEWQYPMVIGARQNRGTVDDVYTGAMDDYRVYNYPLDPFEVATLHTSLAGGEICAEYPIGDFNRDCKVDLTDLTTLAGQWLRCNWVPETACE